MSRDRPLPAWTAAVLAACLGLGAVAFTRPAGGESSYRQQVELGYAADADAGVYDGGRLRTGDPVFLAVVRRFDVEVRYRVDGAEVADVAGRIGLVARVTSSGGWQRTVQIAAPRPFTGRQARLSASVVPGALRKLIAASQQRTATPAGEYQLKLVPRVEATATVGDRRVDLRHEPEVAFRFLATHLVLEAGGNRGRGEPVLRAGVEPPRRAPIEFAGYQVPVSWARLISLTLALAAIVPLAVARVRRRRRDRDQDVVDRRGRRPIDVRRADVQGPAFDVSELADLLDVAHRLDRPLLRSWGENGSATYLVQDGATTYRHAAGGLAWPLPDPLVSAPAARPIPAPVIDKPASPVPVFPEPAVREPASPEPAAEPEPPIPAPPPPRTGRQARHLEPAGSAAPPPAVPRQRRRTPSHRSPLPGPAEPDGDTPEGVLTQDGVDQLRRWLRA